MKTKPELQYRMEANIAETLASLTETRAILTYVRKEQRAITGEKVTVIEQTLEEYQEKMKRSEDMKHEVEMLSKEIRSVRKLKEDTEIHNKHLQKELSESKQELIHQKAENDALIKQMEKLQRTLQFINADRNTMKLQLDHLRGKYNDQKEHIAHLERDQAENKSKIECMEADYQELQFSWKETKNEMNEIKQDINGVLCSLHRALLSYNELIQQDKMLREDLLRIQKKYSVSSDKLYKPNIDNKILDKQVKGLQTIRAMNRDESVSNGELKTRCEKRDCSVVNTFESDAIFKNEKRIE